jgi:hypothetical protein
MHQNIQSRSQKFKIVTTREASKTARHCEQACSQHGQTTKSLATASNVSREASKLSWAVTFFKATNSHLFSLTTHYHLFPYHFRFNFLSSKTSHFSSPKNNNSNPKTNHFQ